MKKYTLLMIIMTVSLESFAQNEKIEQIKESTENSKSGNYKDILTSFFQLATTNFTGSNKTIEMNTTLFAIKSKANPDLAKDTNFKKEKFSRNFQFNFKVNLDDKYKYKGFTGGTTYAIINGRDKQLANFSNTLLSKKYEEFTDDLNDIYADLVSDLIKSNNNPEKISAEIKLMDEALKALQDVDAKIDNSNIYFSKIIDAFKANNLKSKKFEDKSIQDVVLLLDGLAKEEYTKIDAKPLWTVSVDGTAAENGKFNKASIGTIFLQGIKEKSEVDFRAKLVYADTITVAPMPRMDFNAKLGVNFKLAKGANNVSYFEIKGGMEYNAILKNILPTEKKETFLGNAEIRVRLADDLWLPLIIKYDIENANFLGFLNLSYNFGSFTTNDKPKK